jgi:RNA polymerase sigma-70 factor (ECF subfamily)
MVAATLVSVSGERAARPSFRAVFDANHDFVWRALVHLGVPSASVDDALQEVFLVVHRRLDEVDPESPLRGWLWGVARHVASNVRRTGAREGRKRAALAEAPIAASGADAAMANRELVLAALARLDEPMREVLVLSDVEGFSAPELGVALGVSPNTISSRLRIARERFAAAVASLTQEGPER